MKFGFIDVPYQVALTLPRPRVRTAAWRFRAAARGYGSGKTTSQVAERLENTYRIVENFQELRKDDINKILEKSRAETLEKWIEGKPLPVVPTPKDCKAVESLFREFLLNKGMDGKVPGVPTQRALRGVSHRYSNPFAPRAPRPSFIDTGTYMNSFRVTE